MMKTRLFGQKKSFLKLGLASLTLTLSLMTITFNSLAAKAADEGKALVLDVSGVVHLSKKRGEH